MKDKAPNTPETVTPNTQVKELTTYPTVTTLDELKQQVDMIVASGRGSYTVGIAITVDDDKKYAHFLSHGVNVIQP